MTKPLPRKLSYYNFAQLMSYNATYNFCVGARGLGKTYGMKRKVISNAVRAMTKGGKDQFIYLRRYKEEMSRSKDTFFADIAHEFPKWQFRTNGWEGQAKPADAGDDVKWQTICYFVALTQAQHMKGVSFHDVHTVIFDEFILETVTPGYLPGEWKKFNNFYSTVDRWKDKTRVYFLANAVSITNPYFLALKLRPDQDCDKNGFISKREGFVVAHFPDSAKFKNEVYATTFGRFISMDDDYAQFAVENKFRDNHDGMIELRPATATPLFNIETAEGTFSVWQDMTTSTYYAGSKPVKDATNFVLDAKRMDSGKVYLDRSSKLLKKLRTYWNTDRFRFDEPTARNAFIEVFK